MPEGMDDRIAAILLDNILRIMSDKTFSKDWSSEIVGGEKKLELLIQSGRIDSCKPTNKQNGKWYCNAAQVLMHCRCVKKQKPKKSKR